MIGTQETQRHLLFTTQNPKRKKKLNCRHNKWTKITESHNKKNNKIYQPWKPVKTERKKAREKSMKKKRQVTDHKAAEETLWRKRKKTKTEEWYKATVGRKSPKGSKLTIKPFISLLPHKVNLVIVRGIVKITVIYPLLLVHKDK